jgi:transaldolase/glucose-6-phosphate isomerase
VRDKLCANEGHGMNPLKQLGEFGQSVWLDFLSRELLRSGGLKMLIDRDGLKGMTSNPSIFQKAIAQGADYDDDIRRYAEADEDVGQIFRRLSIKDIQDATDALRPVYDATNGVDGFVSIEVSPYLAWETEATLTEARSLWKEIARPNLMVKIPGTKQGIPAIRAAIGEGININVTLLFSQHMYEEVVEAYIAGLEQLARTQSIEKIASVASFFVSRIDSKADAAIAEKLKSATESERALLENLEGKVAIANAKLAYQYFKKAFSGSRWDKLAAKGAKRQRLLWASTSTKNKTFSDVLYVDELIGPDTVNTIPTETMDAFRDHGHPAATLDSHIGEAHETLEKLGRAGISLDKITDELTVEGVELFAAAADKLYGSLAEKREKILGGKLLQMSANYGDGQEAVQRELDAWTAAGNVRRLWAKDKSLWTSHDEDKWLGWLDIVERETENLDRLRDFAKDIQGLKLTDVVLIGMGGSSLGSAVLSDAFGQLEGWPRLHVLDSTDPDRILSVERAVALPSTLFIVASKSGSTLEPNLLKDHFFHLATEKLGTDTGAHFVAITDPGSSLEAVAKRDKFRHVFQGDPEIGGRFSVLSAFGLVPAAAMGLDVERLLHEASRAVTSSRPMTPPEANPGIKFGIALGALAKHCGRDKITLVASEAVATLGTWLEQLIAESTGKDGKGLIPIQAEPLGDAASYGSDRVFIYLNLAGCGDPPVLLDELASRGHPVIRLSMEDTYQFAQMFFLWEIAIAAAGAVIGINPFDQPDVEAQKIKTREMTKAYEQTGALPKQSPVAEFDGVAIYADAHNAKAVAGAKALSECLRALLDQLGPRDYFALLAYIEQKDAHESVLNSIRAKVRDAKHTATVLGFGPRYLHSTGQAYKGGPNEGVFVTVTGERPEKVPIENQRIDFATVQLAQAIGDCEVLNERSRRGIRIHLSDIESGLDILSTAIAQVLI